MTPVTPRVPGGGGMPVTPRALLVLFGAVALAQLAVPARGILRYEAALRGGREYKVRVRPVDPEDPFRGRYLAIRLDLPGPPGACDGECWATLADDVDGFARATSLSEARPASGDAVRVRRGWRGPRDDAGRLELTIDRYYLEEGAARAADRRNLRDDDDYALVRVRNGVAAIAGLVLDGRPL